MEGYKNYRGAMYVNTPLLNPIEGLNVQDAFPYQVTAIMPEDTDIHLFNFIVENLNKTNILVLSIKYDVKNYIIPNMSKIVAMLEKNVFSYYRNISVVKKSSADDYVRDIEPSEAAYYYEGEKYYKMGRDVVGEIRLDVAENLDKQNNAQLTTIFMTNGMLGAHADENNLLRRAMENKETKKLLIVNFINSPDFSLYYEICHLAKMKIKTFIMNCKSLAKINQNLFHHDLVCDKKSNTSDKPTVNLVEHLELEAVNITISVNLRRERFFCMKTQYGILINNKYLSLNEYSIDYYEHLKSIGECKYKDFEFYSYCLFEDRERVKNSNRLRDYTLNYIEIHNQSRYTKFHLVTGTYLDFMIENPKKLYKVRNISNSDSK